MKWFKRLVFSVALLVVVAVTGGIVAWRLGHSSPDWYRIRHLDPQAAAAAARSIDDKVIATLSWAAEAQSAETRARNGTASQPAQGVTSWPITFSEDELNALFHQWEHTSKWDERYVTYISDPAVVLHEGHLILAATARELGTVISAHFEPQIDSNGKLRMKLLSVRSGRLPIPQAAFSKYQTQLEERLRFTLPQYQRRATIAPDGYSNGDAAAAAMAKLLLKSLHDEPAEPLLFVPVPAQKTFLPVRISELKIEDKNISFKVDALKAGQRQALLQYLQEPYATASASSD